RRGGNSITRHAAVIFDENISGPNRLAGFSIEASQFAHRAEDVDFAVAVGWGRPRTFDAEIFLESVRPGACPNLTTAFEIVGNRSFIVSPLFEREGPAMRNRERGITAADGLTP